MKLKFLATLAASTLAGSSMALAQTEPTPSAPTGTLHVDFLNFSSQVKLKPKVEQALKTGGIEWGVKDGLVVFTMVNKRFVNFDMPQFTRFGMRSSVTVPTGDYALTAIGFIPSTSFSAEKMLAKGAYVNDAVVRFKVEAGKATTIEINPVIQKQNTFFINFFQPELLTSVITEQGKSEPVSITAKTDKSILRPAYSGSLKFTVKN